MIPVKLTLCNFMPYREAVLSFAGIHVACLCGDNGNGKSALLDAITWALWGKSRAKNDDDLIHHGMTEMGVELEFTVGGELYRVIRRRSRPKANRPGHSTLDLQAASGNGFRSIAGNSIRETEAKIVKTLRMDYDTFVNSAYLLQGQADKFSKAEPYKRKEVLSNILGLARYDELERRAKDCARQMETDGKVILGEIERIAEELVHKDEYESRLREVENTVTAADRERQVLADGINHLARRKNDLESGVRQREELEAHIRQAESAIRYLQDQVSEYKKRAERYRQVLASYDEEIAKANARRDELSQQQNTLDEKRSENQEISGRIHHLTSTNKRLKEEMQELREKITMLKQGEADCPLCGTELGVGGREKITENYQKQGHDKRETFRTNEKEIKELEQTSNTLRQSMVELERKVTEEKAQLERRTEALNRDHSEAQSSLPREQEAIQKAEGELQRWRSTLEADTRSTEALNADLSILPGLEADLSAAQKKLDDLTQRQSQARQVLGAIQEKLGRIISLEQIKRDRAEEAKGIATEKKIYEELALAFGKKGIQAMIIENVIPEIEEGANRLLAKMTDNRMRVKIETQRAYKSKREGELETLDVNISDELGTRRYEMYSGGEAFRIDFALRIALSKLLAYRAGAPLRTLIIDEGFGSQDASGKERLVEAINSVQGDFDKILVITHIEELKDAFDRRIDVRKTAAGSEIEVG
jgi:exonuclease SbcC